MVNNRVFGCLFKGIFLIIALLSSQGVVIADEKKPDFVGSASCSSCHATEHADWMGSFHQKAMALATPATVRGNFNNASFTYNGVTSKFFRRGEQFLVLTDGPDGKLQEFKIDYTFGDFPLQQYLVTFPGGKIQALSIAWDARPAKEGGQRWYHLYTDEKVDHKDVLHWTKLSQNWNYMCAECHSTNLKKNYDAEKGTYHTTWSEISVGCESCHGPASKHLSWATDAKKNPNDKAKSEKAHGFEFSLKKAPFVARHDPKTKKTLAETDRSPSAEVEACGRCHSRRSVIASDYDHGAHLLATHFPALLTPGLYHADGQIQDEVYEYGSFKQSKMHQSGVACSDCHNPHSLKLRLPDNQVCSQCHMAEKYDTPSHHFHKVGSSGAACKNCHMPEKSYMGIDMRADHSIRIPAPAISAQVGAPDACTTCHTDKSTEWAEIQLKLRLGPNHKSSHDFGSVFHKARTGNLSSPMELFEIISDMSKPSIVRATAVSAAAPHLDQTSVGILARELYDTSPDVRAAAIGALDVVPPGIKTQLLSPLLKDPILGVRIEAARVLASVPKERMAGEIKEIFERVSNEYLLSQTINAESPQAQTNIGIFYTRQQNATLAEKAFRTAIKLEPKFIPASVNLADLYRQSGRDKEGVAVLKEAISQVPNNAEVQFALGLLYIRLREPANALPRLKEAVALQPESFQFTYTYLVALKDRGSKEEFATFLAAAKKRFPDANELANFGE